MIWLIILFRLLDCLKMENIVQCNIEKGDIMAHKTFISYKWSEAQQLRDDIIDALGEDASYYKGETSDSPDLTDTTTDNIKKNLRDSVPM